MKEQECPELCLAAEVGHLCQYLLCSSGRLMHFVTLTTD
jgi:hypothetical protein